MTNDERLQPDYSTLRQYAPYIAAWSGELEPPGEVVVGRTGVRYRDETALDRDAHGVLWYRAASQPGRGDPLFGEVHSLRQRRAMKRPLCHVCGGPPDRTDDGYLWLLPDRNRDWPDWPHGLGVNEPPVCVPCARRALTLCPALRSFGAVAVRVSHAPLNAVHGMLYQPAPGPGRPAVAVDATTVAYTDRRIRWMRAHQQIRTLEKFTIIDVADIRPMDP